MKKQRNVVDYFPHDARASEGDTLTIIESQFGNDGYAFWFKLLEKLSHTDEHYIDCNDLVKWKLLCAKANITPEKAITIVEMLAQLKAIDPLLWKSKVIWCQKLVENFASVYKNRRRDLPQKPVVTDKHCFECGELLVDMRSDAQYCSDNCRQKAHRGNLSVTETIVEKAITTGDNAITTVDNTITTGQSTQSKVEESRVEESKVEESRVEESRVPPPFSPLSEKEKEFFAVYEKHLGTVPSILVPQLRLAAAIYPLDWVKDAFITMSESNAEKPCWRYVSSILERWTSEGRDVAKGKKKDAGSDPEEYYRRYKQFLKQETAT